MTMQSVAERMADVMVELVAMVPEMGADPEGVLKELTREAGRLALEKWLQAGGDGDVGQWRPCRCGGRQVQKGVRERRVMTLLGPVRYQRKYYWCRRCRASGFPKDEQLGWGPRGQTWRVVDNVVLACSQMSYQAAGALTLALAGWRLAQETMETITTEVGTALGHEARPEWEAPEGMEAAMPTTGVIEVDATCVRTLEDWREVKTGAVFRWGPRPGGSEPEAWGTTYFGAMEEAGVFGQRVRKMAQGQHLGECARLVVLGDGAPWIWNQAAVHFRGAVEILDWYHAMEHVWEVAWGLFPAEEERRHAWVEQHKEALAAGRAMQVVIELGKQASRIRSRGGAKRKAALLELLERNRNYFWEHQKRMDYARFRREGLPIGSGIVEGACKHVVGKRMKSASIRWSEPGAHAILELRSRFASGQWDSVTQYLKAA